MHRREVDCHFYEVVDTGPLGTRTDIAPFVGLRHDGVERLFAECLGETEDAWVATVGANVGYVLGGEYLYWDDPKAVDEVLHKITSALTTLSRIRSLDTLTDAVAANVDDPGRHYRLVCLAAIRDRPDEVTQQLTEARATYCARPDAVCEQFLGFERRIRERLPLPPVDSRL